jgi:hypothetical protein
LVRKMCLEALTIPQPLGVGSLGGVHCGKPDQPVGFFLKKYITENYIHI